jgi:hypothetical protein
MAHWIFPSLAAALVAATIFYQRHGKLPARVTSVNLAAVVMLLALGSGSITEIVAEWHGGKVSVRRAEQAARSAEVTKAQVDRIAAEIRATAKKLRGEIRKQRRLAGDLAGMLISNIRELTPLPPGGQWMPRTLGEQRAMARLLLRAINKLLEEAFPNAEQRKHALARFGHAGGVIIVPKAAVPTASPIP